MKGPSVINLEQNENAKNPQVLYFTYAFFCGRNIAKMFLINTPFLQKSGLIAKEKSTGSVF